MRIFPTYNSVRSEGKVCLLLNSHGAARAVDRELGSLGVLQ